MAQLLSRPSTDLPTLHPLSNPEYYLFDFVFAAPIGDRLTSPLENLIFPTTLFISIAPVFQYPPRSMRRGMTSSAIGAPESTSKCAVRCYAYKPRQKRSPLLHQRNYMRSCNKFKYVVATIFLCSTVSPAIDLTGIVVDTGGKPIAGARVALLRNGCADTTEENGLFRISCIAGVTDRSEPGIIPAVRIQRGILDFFVGNAGTPVSIDAFDLKGRRLWKIAQKTELGGRQSIVLPVNRINGNVVSIIRLRIGGDQTTFKVMKPSNCGLAMGSSEKNVRRTFAKAMAGENDTLRISAASYLTKRIALTSLIDTVDSIFLVPADLNFSCGSYPKIDGSTSAQPLACVLASHIIGVSYGWVMSTDGSKRLFAHSTDRPKAADSINTTIAVHQGTHQAYVNIITGKADLSLICRPPSPDEQRLADSAEVELDVIPAAHDAFIFIVNSSNPISGITIKNARDIYTGALTNWNVLGGWNQAIKPYQREANSGSQELMLSLVMKNLTPIVAPDMILLGMMGPFNKLDTDSLGICYTVYFFKEFMTISTNVRSIAIEGITPDYNNIIDRRYPLNADVVVVTRANQPRNSPAYRLREFILSEEGQAVVKESGYVPMFE
jgi:phosphate transport system substrate-binding protein